MTQPTQEELQAALDDFKRLYQKTDFNHKPKPTLEDFGRMFFMNEKIFIDCLKFTMAANNPSKDVVRAGIHTKPQSFGTLEGDIFKAMTAKIWEGIE